MSPSTEGQPPQGQVSNSSYWFITWDEDQMKSQEVVRRDRMQWRKLEFGQEAGLHVPSGKRHGVLVKYQSEGSHSLVPFIDPVFC